MLPCWRETSWIKERNGEWEEGTGSPSAPGDAVTGSCVPDRAGHRLLLHHRGCSGLAEGFGIGTQPEKVHFYIPFEVFSQLHKGTLGEKEEKN